MGQEQRASPSPMPVEPHRVEPRLLACRPLRPRCRLWPHGRPGADAGALGGSAPHSVPQVLGLRGQVRHCPGCAERRRWQGHCEPRRKRPHALPSGCSISSLLNKDRMGW